MSGYSGKEEFSRIYKENAWGHGSGSGSVVENCYPLIGWLQVFLKRQKIDTFIDYGCGDWQWMQYVNLDGIKYRGIDCVDSVVADNVLSFGRDSVIFSSGSIIESIAIADLALFKDVLQHLPNREVIEIVDAVLKKSKYVVAINGSTGQHLNRDIDVGDYRALDLSLPPFDYVVENLLEYSPSKVEVNKVIQLIRLP
jgi:hypothetical protein